MILISEWLPNPTGSDTVGEWVELQNTGNAPVNLFRWSLKTSSGKKFIFGNQTIGADGYLVLPRSETKLTLKNTDEKLFLYDAGGKLIDQSEFLGAAPEGKSVSRTGDTFRFAPPTPGAPNAVPVQTALVGDALPFEKPIAASASTFDFLGLMLGVGIIFGVLLTIAVKRDYALQELFFRKDESAWQ